MKKKEFLSFYSANTPLRRNQFNNLDIEFVEHLLSLHNFSSKLLYTPLYSPSKFAYLISQSILNETLSLHANPLVRSPGLVRLESDK